MQSRDFQEAFKRIRRRYDHSLGSFSSTHWACITTGRSGWAVEEMAVTQRFQSCGGCLFFIFADLLYLKMTYEVFSHTTCLAAYCTRAVFPVFSVGTGARLRRCLDNWRSGFPGGSVVKIPSANAGDLGLIPGLGRSPGEGKGNTLQYSCLENSMDRGAWQATVHVVSRVRHDLVTKATTI